VWIVDLDFDPISLGANALPIPKEHRRLVQTHRRRRLSLTRSRDAAMIARDGRPLDCSLHLRVIQKALRHVAGSGPGSWLFGRVLRRIDRPVYRLTRGRHTFASLLPGIPVVMLTTTARAAGSRARFRCSAYPQPKGLR